MVSDLTASGIESALKRESPANRNAFLRYLGVVLRWGIKRGYLIENPAAKLELTPVKRGEVKIYGVDEVQRLLDDCLDHALELLPYRILTLYCGVRPHGEMSRVCWEDLNWTDKVLKLRQGITKKGRTRFVNVSDNAMQWLMEYKRRGGPTEGRIAPYTRDQIDWRCKHNCRRAGVLGLRNGSRHSWCSYHLAYYRNVNDLTLQSGHASVDVMWRHYHQMVRREDAEKYWQIVPKAAATNVVAFTCIHLRRASRLRAMV
jgi:integrase